MLISIHLHREMTVFIHAIVIIAYLSILNKQTYFWLSLVFAEKYSFELEPQNDFRDVKTFVLLLSSKIHR